MNAIFRNLSHIIFRDRDQHSIPVMDGNLSPNDGLDRAAVLGRFDERPDDVAFGPEGEVYVSVGNAVLRGPAEGGDWQEIARFEGEAGALEWHPDGKLLVCVAGHGLASLAPGGETHWLHEVGGVKLHGLTDVTVAGDGTIYMTEGSRNHPAVDWDIDLMELGRTGRLLVCSARLGDARVLRDNLQWAGGCLAEPGGTVLYSESWAHTVTRCAHDGSGGALVIRNMPGYPGRLAAGSEDSFWIAVFAARTHLVELVLDEPRFRRQMMREVPRDGWIGPALRSTGSYDEPLQGGGIKKLGIIKPWAPPRSYGLVAEYFNDGEPRRSHHSRVGGECHGITGVNWRGGTVYAVSRGDRRLVRIDEGEAA
jgi:hypothetical protein